MTKTTTLTFLEKFICSTIALFLAMVPYWLATQYANDWWLLAYLPLGGLVVASVGEKS